MKRVYIRWMIRPDMQSVLDIERESYEIPWTEEDFLRCLRLRNCIGMVATQNEDGDDHSDRVIGFMLYDLRKKSLELLNFAVAPEFRRMKVGTRMLEKLKAKLSSHRRNRLTVLLRESNLDAQLFFKSQGLEAVRILKAVFDDTGEDGYKFVFFYPSSPSERSLPMSQSQQPAQTTEQQTAPATQPPEPSTTAAAPPSKRFEFPPAPVPTVEDLAGDLEKLLQQNKELQAELELYKKRDKTDGAEARRIAQLQQRADADKKTAAESKAAVEAARAEFVARFTEEHPLMDYMAKDATSANGNGAAEKKEPEKPKDDPKANKDSINVLLDHGATTAAVRKLKDAGINTIGEMVAFQEQKGLDGFSAPLTTIKGVKGKTLEIIDRACTVYWAAKGKTEKEAAKETEKELAKASEFPTPPVPPACTCGADRTGPTAEAHEKSCPAYVKPKRAKKGAKA